MKVNLFNPLVQSLESFIGTYEIFNNKFNLYSEENYN